MFKPRNGNEFPQLYTMNQLLYFVLQLHKTGLFQERTGRLLQLFPSLMFTANSIKLDAVEVDFTRQLVSQFKAIIDDRGVGLQNAELVLNYDFKIYPETIQDAIKQSVDIMLYNFNSYLSKQHDNVLNQLLDESIWNQLLDKLDADRLALGTGMAGMGIALLQNIGNIMFNAEKQKVEILEVK